MKAGKSHGALISLDDARALIAGQCAPLPAEERELALAHGRVLAAPILAARDLPANDISMMDGYALSAAGAPGPLRVAFEVAAGDAPSQQKLERGEAARIFTGAPLPPGADCVAMQEQCTREGDQLLLQRSASPGQHVRSRGEEMRAGAIVLARGAALGAAELSLAAAAGAAKVSVHTRPRVAILTTGDELIPIGTPPPPGRLTETNSLALAQLCREAGAEPILLGIVGDDPRKIAARVAQADAEIFLTTGGASVGEHDHAQEAFAIAGATLIFHGLAIRPGKPALFAAADVLQATADALHASTDALHGNDLRATAPSAVRRLFFGLPGNPAASMLCFELLVRPAIRLLQGAADGTRPLATARLAAGTLSRVPGLTFFPRGRAAFRDGQLEFTPSNQQSSMQIGSWAFANAIAAIPPGEGKIAAGESIEVLLLRL